MELPDHRVIHVRVAHSVFFKLKPRLPQSFQSESQEFWALYKLTKIVA